MADVPDTPAEIRARLQTEALRRAREELRKHAAGNPYRPLTETDHAALQAEAIARARTAIPVPVTPTPVVAALPPETRAALDLPMQNEAVHRAQIKPVPGSIDTEGFLRRVRGLPVWPKLSRKCRMSVARALVWAIGKEVKGVAIISYQGLATAAECCRTQAWRAIKCFRAHGILDIFNVIVREDNELLRDANVYSLRGFTKAIPAALDAVKDAVTGAFDRVSEQVRRFAQVWDMRANHRRSRPQSGAPEPRTPPEPA